jgi:uncharacterized protein
MPRYTTSSSALRSLALLATLAVAIPAHAIDTIDCSRDDSPAERTICSSQRLQILDAKMVEVYADLMSSRWLSTAGKANLQASQRSFLVRRDACGRNFGCLEAAMAGRATQLNFYR